MEKKLFIAGCPVRNRVTSGSRRRSVSDVRRRLLSSLARSPLLHSRALLLLHLVSSRPRTFFVCVSIAISLCFLHLCRRRGRRRRKMPENALLFHRIWCRTWAVVVVLLLLLTPWFFVFEDLSRCSCWKCVFATISGAAVGNASLLDTIRAVRKHPSLGQERERERENARSCLYASCLEISSVVGNAFWLHTISL